MCYNSMHTNISRYTVLPIWERFKYKHNISSFFYLWPETFIKLLISMLETSSLWGILTKKPEIIKLWHLHFPNHVSCAGLFYFIKMGCLYLKCPHILLGNCRWSWPLPIGWIYWSNCLEYRWSWDGQLTSCYIGSRRADTRQEARKESWELYKSHTENSSCKVWTTLKAHGK